MGAFRHVLGVIADPFQRGADLDDRQHHAQIGGGGRAQRDQPRRILVDLGLDRVDRLVAGADLFGQFLVAALQRGRGIGDGAFDHAAHLDQLRLDRLKVAVEGGRDMSFAVDHLILLRRQPMRPEI